jgi:hypothetical protein
VLGMRDAVGEERWQRASAGEREQLPCHVTAAVRVHDQDDSRQGAELHAMLRASVQNRPLALLYIANPSLRATQDARYS